MATFSELFRAVEKEDAKLVRKLIQRGVEVNTCNSHGTTALHYAALLNHIKIVNCLISLGADVNVIDLYGHTPLHSACVEESSLRILTKLTDELRERTKSTISLIKMQISFHKMVQYRKMDMVDCLLKHDANINATFWSNLSSLHKAVRAGSARAVKQLASLGVNVSKGVTVGHTALLLAIQQGHTLLVKHLVENGADLNLCIEVLTPLHLAVEKKRKDLVDILVRHGTDVNAMKNIHGTFTEVVRMRQEHEKIWYIQNLRTIVLKQLVKLGVAVNALEYKIPLIHDTLDNQLMLRHLVQHGADINAQKMCYTVFAAAITEGDCRTIRLLVNCGADVQTIFETGASLVHEAVQRKQHREISCLAELGADVNTFAFSGNTALLQPLAFGNHEASKCLTTAGADVNAKVSLQSPLHQAIRNDDMDAVVALIENGADVNTTTIIIPTWRFPVEIGKARTKEDSSPFSEHSDQELDQFIELGVDFNATDDKVPIIFEAVKCQEPNILQYLIQHGADISKPSVSGTYLMKYCYEKLMLRFGTGYQIQRESHIDRTPETCWQIIKKLLQCGADINAVGVTVKSLLATAMNSGNIRIVEALVKHGAPVVIDPHDPQVFIMERRLLDLAEGNHRFDIVRGLLELGADVNIKQDSFVSALHQAVANGDPILLRALCCLKPNVNSFKRQGMTVLHSHLREKDPNLEMVKLLVEAGADLTCGYNEYVTPLHDAAKLSKTKVVETLYELGADMNSQKWENIQPVHEAAYSLKQDILEYLAEKGADLNTIQEQEVRPLHDAVRVGDIEMVKCLVRCGAKLTATKKSCTPLFAAIIEGGTEVVKCLIHLGADINKGVDKEVTVLHDAVHSHDPQMILALVELGFDVFRVREKQEVSLVGVCVNSNLIDMAHCLLTQGADCHGEQWTPVSAFEEAVNIGSIECSYVLGKLMSVSLGMRFKSGYLNLMRAIKKPVLSAIDLACNNGLLDMIHFLILNRCRLTDKALRRLPLLKLRKHETLTEAIISNYISKSIQTPIAYEPDLILPSIHIDKIPDTAGIGDVRYVQSPKSTDVVSEVSDTVRTLVKNLEFFPRGLVQVIGSMGEGTKVMLPDEMDLLVSFEFKNFKPIDVQDAGFGYARYKDKQTTLLGQGSYYFHIYFTKDIINAMASSERGKGRAQLRSESINLINERNRKACCVLPIQWIDGAETFFISVDVVPCLPVKGWPKNGTEKTWLMDNETLRSRGYLIVPKPPHVKSELAKQCTKEDLEQLWRISFAHLETEHMQRLEQRVKNVYLTAKSLRDPEVCRIFIKEEGSYDKPVDKYVTSYMLKMTFFKNVEHFLAADLDLDVMVVKVYDDLVEALSQEFVPLFFMPAENALNGLKLEVKKCAAVARIMQRFVHKMYDRDHQGGACAQPDAEVRQREGPVYLSFAI